MKHWMFGLAVVVALAVLPQTARTQTISEAPEVVYSQGVVVQPIVVQSAPLYMAPSASAPAVSYSPPTSAVAGYSHVAPSHGYAGGAMPTGCACAGVPPTPPSCGCGHTPPSCSCAGSQSCGCGITIAHTAGCSSDNPPWKPINNDCAPGKTEEVTHKYYDHEDKRKTKVCVPTVQTVYEEEFQFGDKWCKYDCCEIRVCVRTAERTRKYTKCIEQEQDVDILIRRVRCTGLYDVYALGVTGLPKEIILMRNASADEVKHKFKVEFGAK